MLIYIFNVCDLILLAQREIMCVFLSDNWLFLCLCRLVLINQQ